jgi:hypothetical protein
MAFCHICWGGPQKVSLTRDRLRSGALVLAENEMPPTIRDAIHVTEKLGLHLLWVDALCIVQDDPQDKALEISAMADIYASGTITIMASRSSSVDQGFLYRRFPFGTTASDQGIKLACRTRAGKQGSVIAVPDFWGAEEPLDTRGWAFQEYLLSPRILSYGQLHTMWVCDGRARCSERRDQRSDGVAGMPLSSNDNTAKLRERMLDINGTSSLDDGPPPERPIQRLVQHASPVHGPETHLPHRPAASPGGSRSTDALDTWR